MVPRRLLFVMKGVFLFALYVGLSLMLDEFHPFSRFPMYDSFPNYAYSFYIADSKDELVPFREDFRTQANEISHMYCEICDEHKFARGFGQETEQQLNIVGQELLTYILHARKKPLTMDSLSIHRVYYQFEEGKIITHDQQLCKRKVE
jgi:hypothetical protein